jgi:hypothetical protein
MKKMMENQFTTSDFYTAVFLLSEGYQLISIDKADPRRFRFVFADSKDRAKLLEGFFNGQARVEPRKFTAAIKELKSLRYSDAL